MDYVAALRAIAERGSCRKKKVGALIERDGEVLIEAANGRPASAKCSDGNCHRCLASDDFRHGRDHDLCSCLHAEMNAITTAARSHLSIEQAILYSTYQPCLVCLKLIAGAGLAGVRYIEPWAIPDVDEFTGLADDYRSLENELVKGSEAI